jgi:aspartyl aminopeptidase
MQDTEYTEGLLKFIQASPTPFHAVEAMKPGVLLTRVAIM